MKKKLIIFLFFMCFIKIYCKEEILIVSDFYQDNTTVDNIIDGIIENKNPEQTIYIEYLNNPQKPTENYLKKMEEILELKYKDINFQKIIYIEKLNSETNEIFLKNKNCQKIIIPMEDKEDGLENLIQYIIEIQGGLSKIYIPDLTLKEIVYLKKKFYPIDFETFSTNSIYLEDLLGLMDSHNAIILKNFVNLWKFKYLFKKLRTPVYGYNLPKDNEFTGVYIENYYEIGKKIIEGNDKNLKNDYKLYLNGEKIKEFSLKYKKINKDIILYNVDKSYFLIDRTDLLYFILIFAFLGIITLIIILINWNKLIKKLNLLKEEAEESSQVKSNFIASMSHDMKTPLSSIITSVELLSEKFSHEDRLLNIIDSSAKYLTNVINDILILSEYKNKKIEVNYSIFSLEEVFQEIFDMFLPLFYEKNIYFIVYLDEEINEIRSDRIKLKQIIVNLINNSLKFTKEGYIFVKCFSKNKKLEIIIEDTGVGIPKEEKENVFQEFYQIEKNNKNGSGLGLSICKKYLKLLRGFIELDENYTEGARFTIELSEEINTIEKNIYYLIEGEPNEFIGKIIEKIQCKSYFFYDEEELEILLEELNNENILILTNDLAYKNKKYRYQIVNSNYFYNRNKIKEKKFINDNISLKNMKIILAEDNMLNAQLVIESLKKYEIATIHCLNKEEILKFIDETNLILMDINLGDENGYEISKEIKKLNKDITIIGFSATKSNNSEKNDLDNFIEKPMNIKKLLGILNILNYDIYIELNNLNTNYRKLFFQELKNDLKILKENIKNRDYIKIKKMLHKIKGNFLAIGCLTIGKFLDEIEKSDFVQDFYSLKFSIRVLEVVVSKEKNDEYFNS